MTIKDDIIFDKNGFVPPADTNQPMSDNGVLFTSQYYILLKKESLLREEDIFHFNELMNSIVNGGNIRRYPSDTGQEGPDDFIGLCSASKALGTNHAELIYKYGRSTFWNYNNTEPSKYTRESWLGRQPGLIGYIKYCSRRLMNPLEVLALYIGTVITAFGKKEESSDKLLALTMMYQLKDSIVFKPLSWFYMKRINKVYGCVNNLVRIYFGNNHPFSKWWI